LGLSAISLVGQAALSAAEWQALLNNSPFGQSPATPAASTGDLEFRGVVQEEGVYYINLYNPTTKTAQWIPLHGRASDLEVNAYDAASEKVKIIQAGRPLTLSLRRARVSLMVFPPFPLPTPNGGAESPDNPGKDKAVDPHKPKSGT